MKAVVTEHGSPSQHTGAQTCVPAVCVHPFPVMLTVSVCAAVLCAEAS